MALKEYDFFLKITEEDFRNVTIRYNDDHRNVWDPVSSFNIENITKNSTSILAKYEKLKNNPGLPRKQRNKGLKIGAILILCSLPISYLIGEGLFSFIFLIVGFIIYAFITEYYKKLCIDLIKISIALEKKWFYDPFPDSSKWGMLVSKFPEIFMRGNQGQNVEDQFWGKFDFNNQLYDFYSGLFHYKKVTRDSKGRSSTTSYDKNFFCLRLLKPLKSRFFLFTHGTGVTSSEVRSKPVSTESVEFNKYFNISSGAGNENILEIIKTLSPAVQVRLTDLTKTRGPYGLLFSEDCIFFVFNGTLFRKLKTSLFKGIDMSPEDKTLLETEFSTLINLTTDLTRYFD